MFQIPRKPHEASKYSSKIYINSIFLGKSLLSRDSNFKNNQYAQSKQIKKVAFTTKAYLLKTIRGAFLYEMSPTIHLLESPILSVLFPQLKL